ncbi:hypothetical protein SHL15_5620 [Streptomyces hygroscopicus subsp. limoneus]|nr:hypothetical protein SHL15_5620 [Streptomyces hygroscopicus subsp. limoneus]
MTDPSSYPVRLAEDIASLIKTLDDHLDQATPRQAAEILGNVLDTEDGVLARVTDLIGTGSRFAQSQAHRGMLPARGVARPRPGRQRTGERRHGP